MFRPLSRKIFSFLAIAVFFILISCSLDAETLTVTSSADSGPGSLRDTVAEASSGDTIVFASSVTLIELTSPIDIDKNLTIEGPVTISGGGTTNIFIIDEIATLKIEELIIKLGFNLVGGAIENYGKLIVKKSIFFNNGATEGGAIYNEGTLRIECCSVFKFNNDAFTAGVIFNNGGRVFINHSILSENESQDGDGTISNRDGGNVVVKNSLFSNNRGGEGGAIGNFVGGTLVVKDSTFTDNQSTQTAQSTSNGGGAIKNRGTLRVDESIFIRNFTNSAGGGAIFNSNLATIDDSTFKLNFAFDGGAIINTSSGTLTVKESEFIKNHADGDGGAIFNLGTLHNIDNEFKKNTPNDIAP